MQPSVARGFAGFAVSLSLYVGAVIGIGSSIGGTWSCHWSSIAGLGGWGLHCIGHDCGHGSFSRNRRLNFVVGHLALLPLLYPFHAWRHVHNWHHAHTNSLELDSDWRPISEAVYRRMPLRYRVSMSACAPGRCGQGRSTTGPIRFPAFVIFRRRRSVAKCAGQSVFVVTVRRRISHAAHLPCRLARATALFRRAWFAIHAWFSITTLMHHSSEDIPFLPDQYWTRNASKLLVTTDFIYPRWLFSSRTTSRCTQLITSPPPCRTTTSARRRPR